MLVRQVVQVSISKVSVFQTVLALIRPNNVCKVRLGLLFSNDFKLTDKFSKLEYNHYSLDGAVARFVILVVWCTLSGQSFSHLSVAIKSSMYNIILSL